MSLPSVPVFLDVTNIQPGQRFPEQLDDNLKRAAVVLVVMDRHWLTTADEYGRRRIDQPGDWVAHEVRTALDEEIVLIPVLIDDTEMPPEQALPSDLVALAARNAYTVRHDRWDADITRLVQRLRSIVVSEVRRGIYESVSHPPTPGTAPALPALFVGREHDLEWARRRLARTSNTTHAGQPNITVVRGWPGVGKTTFGAAIAHDDEIRRSFSDGVLWTSLGQHPNVLRELQSWVRALGHPSLLGSDVGTIARGLTGALVDKRILLIIDDVWDDAAVQDLLVAGRNGATLFTTRLPEVATRLAPTPSDVYELGVLSDDAGLELMRLVAPHVVENDLAAARALVRDVEGLPLALRVAGGLLGEEAKLRGLDVTGDILREIREGRALLEQRAPSDRTVGGTPPTVETLFQLTTDTLDAATRTRFSYLGALAPKPATFDHDAMQGIWGINDPWPTIRTLVNRGLLEPTDGGRFWMHAMVAAHAASLLD